AYIIQNLKLSPKTEGSKTKAARCLFFLMSFPFCLHFSKFVCLLKKTAEIETGMAEKSSWDKANIWQKQGLVWRHRKKISQIIKDYFY
ncbi:MAG: hypothetical protein ACK559_06670, partial [bacterium]